MDSANTASLSKQFVDSGATEQEIKLAFRNFNAYAEAFRRESDSMNDKTIKVDYLARVEGEGSIYVKIKNNEVTDVKFKVFEPPRFFEAFLRGRNFSEAPDITSRICGICRLRTR